jgi:hypothetical protein
VLTGGCSDHQEGDGINCKICSSLHMKKLVEKYTKIRVEPEVQNLLQLHFQNTSNINISISLNYLSSH